MTRRRTETGARFVVAGLLSVATAAAWAAPPTPSATPERVPLRWYKGNTHTHTLNTDGDSVPEDVVRWYRQQKYHFLVISDHDMVTAVDGLNATYGAGRTVKGARRAQVPSNEFLLIPGEEVTDRFSPRQPGGEAGTVRDPERKEIHLTAVNVRDAVASQGGTSLPDTLQRNVDAIRGAGGFPIVNHPNFAWALTAADLAGLRGAKAFELWSGHQACQNQGGAGRPGTEQIWDDVLSRGTLIYGVAADDAHTFRDPVPTTMSVPGRAWIMVRAADLTAEAIVGALEKGDFYASTGVELADYDATPRAITVAVKPRSLSKYDVHFIGRGGRVLKSVPVDPEAGMAGPDGRVPLVAPPVVYEIRGDEGYVRAKVVESNGNMAWTQPVLVPAP